MARKDSGSTLSWNARYAFERTWALGRLRVRFSYRRARENLWGRFGGGWNWALGFKAGGRSLLILLLIAELALDWRRNEPSK